MDLSRLDPKQLLQKPRFALGKDAATGVYCLDGLDPCKSQAILVRNAMANASPAAVEEAITFLDDDEGVPPRSFRQNRVPRKEATFGPIKYKQYHHVSNDPTATNYRPWPALVTEVLRETQKLAAKFAFAGVDADKYNSVHTNLYRDQYDSVDEHADDEACLIKGAPIYSWTFLETPALPRDFRIWESKDRWRKRKADGGPRNRWSTEVTLHHGDLLIMAGDMQECFTHGIEKVPAGTPVSRRLNFTVRQFERKM